MASYDSTVNSGNITAQGRGSAFQGIQSPAVAAAGAPNPPPPGAPQGAPAGSPGGPPGSVAQGAFPPGQIPPQLANILMGQNPNNPTQPNVMPQMPGSPGGMGGGAFASGFGNGTALGTGMPRSPMPQGPMTASQGAFGRMGPAAAQQSWGGK